MAYKAKAAEGTEVVEEVEVPAKQGNPVEPESVYTVRDFVQNYKAFDTYREIVEIALKMEGVESATFEDAKRIVEKFKNREVK